MNNLKKLKEQSLKLLSEEESLCQMDGEFAM